VVKRFGVAGHAGGSLRGGPGTQRHECRRRTGAVYRSKLHPPWQPLLDDRDRPEKNQTIKPDLIAISLNRAVVAGSGTRSARLAVLGWR